MVGAKFGAGGWGGGGKKQSVFWGFENREFWDHWNEFFSAGSAFAYHDKIDITV